MKASIVLLAFVMLILWLGVFAMGMSQGQVIGRNPVHGRWAWIAKSDHHRHFWLYALLHLLAYVLLAWTLFAVWSAPAF